jgi:hypothetical protein
MRHKPKEHRECCDIHSNIDEKLVDATRHRELEALPVRSHVEYLLLEHLFGVETMRVSAMFCKGQHETRDPLFDVQRNSMIHIRIVGNPSIVLNLNTEHSVRQTHSATVMRSAFSNQKKSRKRRFVLIAVSQRG